MGFYAVISNPNGNAGIIVITCHSKALLITAQEHPSLTRNHRLTILTAPVTLTILPSSQDLCCSLPRLKNVGNYYEVQFRMMNREGVNQINPRDTKKHLLKFLFLFTSTIFLPAFNQPSLSFGVLQFSILYSYFYIYFEVYSYITMRVIQSLLGNMLNLELHHISCWQTNLVTVQEQSINVNALYSFKGEKKKSFFNCLLQKITEGISRYVPFKTMHSKKYLALCGCV